MLHRKKIFILAALALGLAQGFKAHPAVASDFGDGVSGSSPSGWTFTFTTYSWLPWLSGDAAILGRSFDVAVSPDDILKNLDWSTIPVWMSSAEMKNGRFTLLNDIVYSAIAGSAGIERSFNGRFLSATVKAGVEADYKQTTIELGGAYEIWANGAERSAGHSALELLAGGRYWRQELNVSVDVSASATLTGPLGLIDLTRSGNRLIAKSGTVDWVDPFVGARLRYDVDPSQWLTVRGDIGGFGAGSDFSWQAMAAYNWQVCLTGGYEVDAYVGYRALSVDYSEGSGNTRYEYDVIQHGPVLGASVKY